MEVIRHWRLKKIRYGLSGEICSSCGQVTSECPTGIRNFVEGRREIIPPKEIPEEKCALPIAIVLSDASLIN